MNINQLTNSELVSILSNSSVITNEIKNREKIKEQEALKIRLEKLDLMQAIDADILKLQLEVKKMEEKVELSFAKWNEDKNKLFLLQETVNVELRKKANLWKEFYKEGECFQAVESFRVFSIASEIRNKLRGLVDRASQIPKDPIGRALAGKNINQGFVEKNKADIHKLSKKLRDIEVIYTELEGLRMARISPNELQIKVASLAKSVDEIMAD